MKAAGSVGNRLVLADLRSSRDILRYSGSEIVSLTFVLVVEINPPTKPKKKKLHSTWCHDFVCLSSTTATKPPSSLETFDLMINWTVRTQSVATSGHSQITRNRCAPQKRPRPLIFAAAIYDLLYYIKQPFFALVSNGDHAKTVYYIPVFFTLH